MKRFVYVVLAQAGLLAGWQVLAHSGAAGLTVPAPAGVIRIYLQPRFAALLYRSAIATITSAAAGFVVGALAGTATALLAYLLPPLRAGLDRLAVTVNAIPAIVLGPIFILLVSRDLTPALLAAISVFFLIYVAAASGLRSASPSLGAMMVTFGAGKWQLLRYLDLPAALPSLLSGVKVSVTAAMIGAIVGEWFGAPTGLGIVILNTMQNFEIPLMWAAVLLVATISLAGYGAAQVADPDLLLKMMAFANNMRFSFRRKAHTRPYPVRRGRKSGYVAGGAEASMIRRVVAQSWGLLLIFAVWQVWVMSAHYNSIVIVSPLAVMRDIGLHPMVYLAPALWTLGFAVSGLAAGMLVGLLLAIAAWQSQFLSAAISPGALLLSSTPVVCLIPLLARIFGYESRTEFVTVSIMTFFPGVVYASKGLRMLPPGASEFFAVVAATRGQHLLRLALPAAVPELAVALRIGAAYSVMVTMISEYLMQTGGLGNMFALTSQAFQTERAWGASLVAMTLSVGLYTAAGSVETWIRNRYR